VKYWRGRFENARERLHILNSTTHLNEAGPVLILAQQGDGANEDEVMLRPGDSDIHPLGVGREA
jgi:hypothetical protein